MWFSMNNPPRAVLSVIGLAIAWGGCTAARQTAKLAENGVSGSVPTAQQASGQIAANLAAEIQTEFAALRQDVGQQVNGLIACVDRSVNNYDAWTLRINALCQAAGAWLPWIVVGVPVVTCVLPKLAWKGASALRRTVKR